MLQAGPIRGRPSPQDDLEPPAASRHFLAPSSLTVKGSFTPTAGMPESSRFRRRVGPQRSPHCNVTQASQIAGADVLSHAPEVQSAPTVEPKCPVQASRRIVHNGRIATPPHEIRSQTSRVQVERYVNLRATGWDESSSRGRAGDTAKLRNAKSQIVSH